MRVCTTFALLLLAVAAPGYAESDAGQHVGKPRFRQFVCFGLGDSNCSPADRGICVLNLEKG